MDWSKTELLAIRGCSAVAVYDSGDGYVVITQRGPSIDESDDLIVIPFDRLKQLIAALQRQLPEE